VTAGERRQVASPNSAEAELIALEKQGRHRYHHLASDTETSAASKFRRRLRTTEKPNLIKELVLLLALSTLWGASYSFIKFRVEGISPATLIAARTFSPGRC
jgi:hypothetical protein